MNKDSYSSIDMNYGLLKIVQTFRVRFPEGPFEITSTPFTPLKDRSNIASSKFHTVEMSFGYFEYLFHTAEVSFGHFEYPFHINSNISSTTFTP